jgi:predicted bacteriocin transport accessory protein
MSKRSNEMNKSKNSKLIIGLASIVVSLIAILVVLNVLRGTRLVVIGISEMNAILNDQSGQEFVYIGRPTCPYCEEFKPVLEATLSELGQELVYFETDLADLEDQDRRIEILEQLGVGGVPVIVYIENGQAVDSITGVQTRERVLEFFESNGELR